MELKEAIDKVRKENRGFKVSCVYESLEHWSFVLLDASGNPPAGDFGYIINKGTGVSDWVSGGPLFDNDFPKEEKIVWGVPFE